LFAGCPETLSISDGVFELDRDLIDLALRRGRLLVRDDVRAAGISPGQWARRTQLGLWVALAPGAWRHLATEETWALRARAVLHWLGDDAALHGLSALHWWGVDPREPDEVEVFLPRGRRSVRQSALRGVSGPCRLHTGDWRPSELRRRDGIRLQEPGRAIVAAAAHERSARELERIIDESIRQRLMSRRSLSERIAASAGSGHPGIRLLRSLLLDSGGESYLERRFLGLVRRAGLPRPQCQVVHRSGSTHLARVDFLFPGTDVVVEVTGRLGHASDAERRADARRRNALQRAGRVVLEFTTADVLDEQQYVLATLVDWLST
jgi:hypothetical protein